MTRTCRKGISWLGEEGEQNHRGRKVWVVPEADRFPAPSFLDPVPKLAGLLAATQDGDG